MGARLALSATLALLLGAGGAVRGDEPPSLARALYLERTAKDFEGALAAYAALRASAPDPASRAEAALGQGRALLALGRVDPEALEVWRSLAADAEAPVAARDEARALLDRHRPPPPDPAASAEPPRDPERDLAEQARAEAARRAKSARRFVETARAHVAARRYESARDDLIQALQLDPDDPQAAALLEEVGGYLEDRGDVLRQALRFVANSRLSDFRHLSGDLDALRERGRRALRDGRPADAARAFRDAVDRVDGSDFRPDLADRRTELVMLLRRAVDDTRAQRVELEEGLATPPEGRAPAADPSAWGSEFYALLARVVSSRGDETAPLRFYEVAPAPSTEAGSAGARFSSSGLPASQGPGSLRRARWVERHVRATVAPGSWSSSGRLLDRSDDTLIVQHLPDVHRRIGEVLAAFAPGAPSAVSVDVAVLGAKAEGLAEAAQILHARAAPHERGMAHVVGGTLLEEQVRELTGSVRIALLGRATVLLGPGRRTSAVVRFAEPTANVPLYRDREGARFVVPDGDETYGLEVELYAEDLPGQPGRAALSAVATARRPDRARTLPLANGPARVPVLLAQTVEADRVVPHAGSLAILGLGNPFLGTGAAGDPGGGSHPDLVVLVAVRPAAPDGGPAPPPDVPRELPEPPPRIVPGEHVTREHDLGPIGATVRDEAPPEDWPATPASRPAPLEASQGARDAFLARSLRERANLGAGGGTLDVREGRVVASLPSLSHPRLEKEVEALRRHEEVVFEVSVAAVEARTDRVQALLAAEGVREIPVPGAASARAYGVSGAAAGPLDERLSRAAEPGSPFTARTRLAARHTQLVTARAVSVRDVVDDFRVVRRPDGTLRALPVNGTAEDGLVATLRPVAHDDGSATLHAAVTLARLERVEPWRPAGGPDRSPVLDAPRHQVERAAASLRLPAGDSLLIAVPSPGTGGARTVLLRATVRRLDG